ncbi:MAG: caspase family protein, partial [Candidatus Parabeggiatoa sp.]|nr:caspase family protein [Candidatus Parabeggiatoa sp.]
MMTRIDPNNTQAILIGASEFDFANEDFQNLPNVKTNLLELNRLLNEVVGIDKNKICLMLDRDDSSKITSEIIKILPNASDTIIVYYAGHGIFSLSDFYLATKETQPNEPEYTGAIPSKHLVDLVIKKAKVKNIIFIIDCCFSAMAKERVNSRNKQVFFITAAPFNKPAQDESPENANYTAFTHELLLILKQGIENAGEFLTFQNIANHLIKQLKDKGLPEPQLSTHGSPDELGICKNQAYHHDPADQDLQPIQSAKYTKQISEITEYVENFFLFAQQNKFQDALGNGRRLAEAICKMVLFVKKGKLNQLVIYKSSCHASPVEIKIDGVNYKF